MIKEKPMSDVVDVVVKIKDLPEAVRLRLDGDPEMDCQITVTVLDKSVIEKREQVLRNISDSGRDCDKDVTDIVRKNRDRAENNNGEE